MVEIKSGFSLILIQIIFHQLVNGEKNDVLCDNQLSYFKESLAKHELWALQLYDSWSKLQSGVFMNNNQDLGNYDQCVKFKHNSEISNIGEIHGKYCVTKFKAIQNKSVISNNSNFDLIEIGDVMREYDIQLGGAICVPKSCSSEKIQIFINEYLQNANLQLVEGHSLSYWCMTDKKPALEIIDWFCIFVILALMTLMTGSTIYELLSLNNKQKPDELLSSFSIYKNGKKLFHIEKPKESSTQFFACLSGMRTFAMLHVLLGHAIRFPSFLPMANLKTLKSDGGWLSTYFGAFWNVHPVAVDTFFAIGGMLLTRSMLSQIDRKRLNIPKLYLHRYLRITPVLAFLILIVLSINKFFGDGPFYKEHLSWIFNENCEKNWWVPFFHIQNYYVPLEYCYTASWYLSADFQLVLISPLIMYPLYKWGWKFLWTLPVYTTATEVWIFISSLQNDFKGSETLMSNEVIKNSKKLFYYPTHIRCGAWLWGVVLGYYLFQKRNSKIVINKKLSLLLWTIFVSTLIAILFGLKPLHDLEHSNKIGNALWLALHRNSWALAICWIILSCLAGGGGVFKWFLELPVWQPFGRMSLSFYLVHVMVLQVRLGSIKTPNYFDNLHTFHSFAGDFLFASFFAVLLYLSIEEPFLQVENYIYKKIREKKQITIVT